MMMNIFNRLDIGLTTLRKNIDIIFRESFKYHSNQDELDSNQQLNNQTSAYGQPECHQTVVVQRQPAGKLIYPSDQNDWDSGLCAYCDDVEICKY